MLRNPNHYQEATPNTQDRNSSAFLVMDGQTPNSEAGRSKADLSLALTLQASLLKQFKKSNTGLKKNKL